MENTPFIHGMNVDVGVVCAPEDTLQHLCGQHRCGTPQTQPADLSSRAEHKRVICNLL